MPIVARNHSDLVVARYGCAHRAHSYNGRTMNSRDPASQVVLVDGVRTPFRRAGTDYLDLISYDLARTVLAGLLERTTLSPGLISQVVMGNVIQNPLTSNVARDAALAAGFPQHTPAHTVTLACISANRAIADAALALASGRGDFAVAGGVELLSDVPPVFDKKMRRQLFEARKAKGPVQMLSHLRRVGLKKMLPGAPAIAEYTTGESMGRSADRLAARFNVSRLEQDSFALRSHTLAAAATEAGHLADEIMPVALPPRFALLDRDNTFRTDTSMESLGKLNASFVKPFGTVTAGNSSPLTDGAAAVLLARREAADAHGLPVRAIIRDWLFTAQDPADELLLGPAYATPQLLQRNKLTWNDLDVIEIHEAFAGQVLAVLAAMSSDSFGVGKLGLTGAFADPSLEKINLWGGSLSLGHPFGATGARLATTAASRLEAEDGQLALVTACAAGGQAVAMLLERVAS